MFGKPFNLNEETLKKVSDLLKERPVYLNEKFDAAAIEVAQKLSGVPFETRTKMIKEAFYAACESQDQKINAKIANTFSSMVLEHFNTLSEKCGKKHYKEMEDEKEDDVIVDEKYSKKNMKKEEKQDSEYQKFFKSMLKKHGYNSPADIPNDKKDDFFNKVDKEYKAMDEEADCGCKHKK